MNRITGLQRTRSDHIKINGLSLNTYLNASPLSTDPESLQRVVISLDILYDITNAAVRDDYKSSIDYTSVSAAVIQRCRPEGSQATQNRTVDGFAERIAGTCLSTEFPTVQEVMVKVEAPQALLRGRGAGVQIVRRRDGTKPARDSFFVRDLRLHIIIGVFPPERVEKQTVIINLSTERSAEIFDSTNFDFNGLVSRITEHTEKSSYFTLEALTSEIAHESLKFLRHESYTVTVGVAKPAALPLADSAEIMITRSLSDFPMGNLSTAVADRPDQPIVAALAVGSNLGDRFRNIELALRILEDGFDAPHTDETTEGVEKQEVTIIDTSFMYETAPMYVLDQPSFINCACMVETTLSPVKLLELLKKVEAAVGRVPGIRFGPRAVDLDLISYGSQIIDTRLDGERETLDNLEGQLVVPHPRMEEREFVLRPLNDIMPGWSHPRSNMSIRVLLETLLASQQAGEPVTHKVMPFPSSDRQSTLAGLSVPPTSTYWSMPASSSHSHPFKPYLMATLNVTPDSFSDGSVHSALPDAPAYVRASVAAGADIIDIGGYSTRPGAAFVSAGDETARVVPAIRAIRASGGAARDALLSVDTFRWEVARAAILAGANCINDVCAFAGPAFPAPPAPDAHFDKMRAVARELAVPVVMMHSRGDAGKNKDYAVYDGGVIAGVQIELGEKVERAIRGKGGIRRWLVIVDPGVGFSKTVEDNLQILRHASDITADALLPQHAVAPNSPPAPYASPRRNPLAGFPQLIGASRKSFLGTILSRPAPQTKPGSEGYMKPGRETSPKERGYATAAAVACAVQQGATIVRVHDVQESADVIRVASALWG